MKKRFALLFLAFTFVVPAEAFAATTFKLGTLAPRRSSWMSIFKRAIAEIDTLTGGAVKFQLFPGGTQGDEKVAVEKMRTGQLHAAAITAVGLAEIAPEVLVLQAPGLITDYRTLDKVRNKLQARFEKKFEDNGFVLLGWGDVGEVDYFSNIELKTPDQLKSSDVKMWIWNADPVARNVAKTLGIRGVPRGVPDVLPDLNNKRINTLYSSALACLQLQWCNHMKYRTNKVVAVGIGAIVFSKKALEALSPEHQKIVRDTWKKWSGALTRKIRKDNAKARLILEKKKGMQTISIDASEGSAWDKVGRKVQDALVGKIYDQALLNQVRKLAGK